jgi:hypothetical protein
MWQAHVCGDERPRQVLGDEPLGERAQLPGKT